MVKTAFAAIAVGVCCSVVTAEARVTRIEILKTERVDPSPATPGVTQTPPYERLSGKFYGELDPADPKNARITDIQFAPRNARGKVEYVGTFSLMKPLDLSRASGVLIYSVVNRGNGVASAGPEGHISLVSGWQEHHRAARHPHPRTERQHRGIDHPACDAVPVSGGDARHDEGDARVGRVGERHGRQERAGEDCRLRLDVRDVREDAVSRDARSCAHLPEERLRSRAPVRAAVHGEGSAGSRHWLRGH